MWTPGHLSVYRLRPWAMARFTVGELETIQRDLRKLEQEARKVAREQR